MTDRAKDRFAVFLLMLAFALFVGISALAVFSQTLSPLTQTLTVPPSTQPTTITVSVSQGPPTSASAPEPAGTPSLHWLGMNLDANSPWQTAAPWCDVCHQMTGWYAVDGTSITYDPNGYPLTGHAQCHCWLYDYPAGVYHLHWSGPGPLYVSGKTLSGQKAEGSGQGADVTFASGEYAQLYATGPVSDVHLYAPDTKAGHTFRDVFLNAVRPWRTLRLMPWCYVNYAPGSGVALPPTTAAGRVTAASFDQTTRGVAYEFMAELAQEANLDAVWVDVPYMAQDDYLAAAARAFLGCSCGIDVEYGNELWNTGAGYQGNLIRADAKAAPAGTYGTDSTDANVLGARRAAVLGAHAGAIFRQVLGASKVKVVFGAQATWSAWASDGLAFGTPTSASAPSPNGPAGTPAFQVLAVAPYFQPFGGDPVSTVPQIEASCTKWIDTVLDPNLKANAALAAKFGCAFWAYEGGQSLMVSAPQSVVPSGVMLQFNAAQTAAFNADPFTIAQTDPGMGTVMDHLFSVAKKDGITRFEYFLLIGDWGRSGYWGVYRGLNDVGGIGGAGNVKAVACRRAG